MYFERLGNGTSYFWIASHSCLVFLWPQQILKQQEQSLNINQEIKDMSNIRKIIISYPCSWYQLIDITAFGFKKSAPLCLTTISTAETHFFVTLCSYLLLFVGEWYWIVLPIFPLFSKLPTSFVKHKKAYTLRILKMRDSIRKTLTMTEKNRKQQK